MRRLAFNFPKHPSTGPDSKQKKAKPRQGKVRICHWRGENVDTRVKKTVDKEQNPKACEEKENQVSVTTDWPSLVQYQN